MTRRKSEDGRGGWEAEVEWERRKEGERGWFTLERSGGGEADRFLSMETSLCSLPPCFPVAAARPRQHSGEYPRPISSKPPLPSFHPYFQPPSPSPPPPSPPPPPPSYCSSLLSWELPVERQEEDLGLQLALQLDISRDRRVEGSLEGGLRRAGESNAPRQISSCSIT
eukprot:749449-Hanusia_phi.AAC.2